MMGVIRTFDKSIKEKTRPFPASEVSRHTDHIYINDIGIDLFLALFIGKHNRSL
jgi:hypothetical protein